MKETRLGFRINPELKEDLEEFCKRENMTLSDAIRFILDRYLDNYFGADE